MVQSRKELKLISSAESAGTMELDPTTRYSWILHSLRRIIATCLSGVQTEGNEKCRLRKSCWILWS